MSIKITPYNVFLFIFASCFLQPVTAIEKSDNLLPAARVTSYAIGPGDVLRISVWKEEDMQLQVVVKPDGGITFPLIGSVIAGGLTTTELTDSIVKKLEKYIPSPNVTVTVMQAASNKIYVIGKVSRPGEFTATRYIDVLQALTLAGGLTPFAEADEIKVIRRGADGEQVFEFDYDEVSSGEGLEMNIILKAGDTIIVP